jgi:hypothetical protein
MSLRASLKKRFLREMHHGKMKDVLKLNADLILDRIN